MTRRRAAYRSMERGAWALKKVDNGQARHEDSIVHEGPHPDWNPPPAARWVGGGPGVGRIIDQPTIEFINHPP